MTAKDRRNQKRARVENQRIKGQSAEAARQAYNERFRRAQRDVGYLPNEGMLMLAASLMGKGR